MASLCVTKLSLFFSLMALLSACGGSGGNPPLLGGATVNISGVVTFDHVPTSTAGLNYSATTAKPSRGVVVEAIRSGDATLLDSTVTDAAGAYTLSVAVNTDVTILVKAQMLKTGSPSWDFRVVDNTRGKGLYAMASSSFNSGSTDISGRNLNAPSGWGGSFYSGERIAASFAMLNTVYMAVEKVTAADATVNMPQLLINWSVNNVPSSGNIALGQIVTSHFDGNELFILGRVNNDTDEYDEHIIAHEWGHYFENILSRSDSLGGPHGEGDKLDPRVAFGEGFGNALSGMVTGNAIYTDTMGSSQGSSGILMDLDDNDYDSSSVGWYGEASVQSILYDLYDASDDGPDSISLGFAPIYNVLVNEQRETDSFTTIHSFISFLKANNPASITAIDTLLAYENITTAAIDEWDSTATEVNNGGSAQALPLYKALVVGGPAVTVCSSGLNGNYNKLMNHQFLRVDIPTAGSYAITASNLTAGGDGAIVAFRKGVELAFEDAFPPGFAETMVENLSVGWHVIQVFDWRITIDALAGGECFEVAIN